MPELGDAEQAGGGDAADEAEAADDALIGQGRERRRRMPDEAGGAPERAGGAEKRVSWVSGWPGRPSRRGAAAGSG